MPRVAIGVCSRRKRQIRAAGGRQSCELYSLRSDAGHLFSEYSVTGVHRSLSRSRRRLCNHSSVGEYAQLHRSCAKSDTVQRSACYSSCQLSNQSRHSLSCGYAQFSGLLPVNADVDWRSSGMTPNRLCVKCPQSQVVSMGRRNTQLRPTFIENKS
jgi:hypothetical protein